MADQTPAQAYEEYLARLKASQGAQSNALTNLRRSVQAPLDANRGNYSTIYEDPSRVTAGNSASAADRIASVLPEAIGYAATPAGEAQAPSGISIDPQTRSILKAGVGQGLSMAGANPYLTKAAGPVISALTGDIPGALRQGSGTLAGMGLNAAGVPSPIIGPLVSIVSGVVGGDSQRKIAENAVNSAIGGVASMAGPIGSAAYSIARMFGLNPAQGMGEGMGMYPEVPTGTEGGYWGKRGQGYEEDGRFMSGNKSYSPYGGASYEDLAQNKLMVNSGNENYSPYGGLSYDDLAQQREAETQAAYEQQAAMIQQQQAAQQLAQQQAAADAYERQLATQQAGGSGNYSTNYTTNNTSGQGGYGSTTSGNENYSRYGGSSYSESNNDSDNP